MCEFMTTPLSDARRGNPDFTSGHDLTGRLFFGSFLCAVQRNERRVIFWISTGVYSDIDLGRGWNDKKPETQARASKTFRTILAISFCLTDFKICYVLDRIKLCY